MKSALRRADACVGRRTQLLFRSPGFNFDPVNSPQNQAAFSKSMRPIVEDAGMIYIDNYPATYDAVFQDTPQAVKFAKNSAFHYLNAGRYLMAQLVLVSKNACDCRCPNSHASAGSMVRGTAASSYWSQPSFHHPW